MKPTYRIKDWNENFENHESRKVKRAYWVAIPNKHDGKSFRRIAAHPEGVQIFAAWCLILEVASKMPERGILADQDGPLDAEDLAAMTGFPSSIFDSALNLLIQDKFGWLTSDKISRRLPKSPGNLPESPGVAGETAALPGETAVEGNGMELNGTELNGREEVPPAQDFISSLKTNPAYSHVDFDREAGKMKAWLSLPANKGRKMTDRFVLNWLNKIERPVSLSGNGSNGAVARFVPNDSPEVCTRCFNTGVETTHKGARPCNHE